MWHRVAAGILLVIAQGAAAAQQAEDPPQPAGEGNVQSAESVDSRVRELLEAASSYLEEDAAKREAAKNALVEIGGPAAPLLVSRLDTSDIMELIAVSNVIPRIGESAVDALNEAFLSPTSPQQHRRVIGLIGAIGSARSAAILMKAASDRDWAVRAAAAGGLGHLAGGDETARARLYELLHDEDWGVRLRATWAMGDAGLAGSIDTLTERLDDAHFAVRLAAAELLAAQGTNAVGAIARHLEARVPTRVVRLTCLDTLGQTRQPAAAVHIEPLLIDEDPIVRVHAARAYGSTAPQGGAALCAVLRANEPDPAVARALRTAETDIRARTAAGAAD